MTDGKAITLTYLNIRQSIAVLLAKLVAVDILMAGIVIFLYWTLITGSTFFGYDSSLVFLFTFIALGLVKAFIDTYVILLWLNEYYEITPDSIVHRKGVIFRKTQMYDVNKVRSMDVQDTFLGEMFNFATITLYDIRLNKYLDMYLIHNAQRYAHVLKQLRPSIEISEDKVRLPFMHKDEVLKEHE